MENIVQASFQPAFKDYMKMNRYESIMNGNKVSKFFIFMLVISLLFIVTMAFIYIQKKGSISSYIIMTSLPLLFNLLPPHLKAREKYRKLAAKRITYNYKLYSDGFSVEITSPSQTDVVESDYRPFMSAVERKDAFYFHAAQKREAYIIPKGSIMEGSVEKLRGLFRKNLGMKFYI